LDLAIRRSADDHGGPARLPCREKSHLLAVKEREDAREREVLVTLRPFEIDPQSTDPETDDGTDDGAEK
jgi:hypothetical protein